MSVIRFLFQLLISGNFYISFGAALLTLESYFLMNRVPDPGILFLVFLSSFVLYNTQRLVLDKGTVGNDEGKSFIHKYRLLLWTLTGISIIPGCYLFLAELNWQQQVFLLIGGVFSLAYFFPGIGLRKVPLLKAFLVALCWAITTVGLIWEWKGDEIFPVHFFFDKFLFILALALLFDIRDIRSDRESGTRSIPVLLGIPFTQWLALAALGMSILIVAPLFGNWWMISVVYGITLFFVFGSNEKRKEEFYTVGVDGMIILRALIIIVFSQNSIL